MSQVGAEQSYNIKELITARNAVVPFMTELDVLQVRISTSLIELYLQYKRAKLQGMMGYS